MQIEIERVKCAINRILEHIIENKGEKIKLDDDFYWNISREEIYNPYQKPKKFDIGQLSDDLMEINKIASGENSPISFGLVWASSLLRAIGEKIVS